MRSSFPFPDRLKLLPQKLPSQHGSIAQQSCARWQVVLPSNRGGDYGVRITTGSGHLLVTTTVTNSEAATPGHPPAAPPRAFAECTGRSEKPLPEMQHGPGEESQR